MTTYNFLFKPRVTYWPSTVEFGADATPTRSRWMSNNYITRCHRQFELVGISCSWSSSCSLRQWEPVPSRGLGPSGFPVGQPSRMRKKCCYSQRNLGSICCSLFGLQLTSHTQPFCNPFENKVWDVYFSKELCSFVIIVDYVSAYICMCIVVYVLCGYTTHGNKTKSKFPIFFFLEIPYNLPPTNF